MPSEDHVRDRILVALPGALVEVTDYTGTGDHFRAVVESDAFHDLSRVEQHKLVYRALDGDMGDHSIHALALTTRVPAATQETPS
jgi:stress-induced morphogen